MTKPKILFVDIEATNLAANFGYVLCIGYKWAHQSKAKIISISDFSRFKKDVTDDREVLKKFAKVIDDAEIIIHHYGAKFDLPYLQTRMLVQKLPLLVHPPQIDTWRTLKYKLKLTNNKLDTLLKTLTTKVQKTPLSGPIWVKAAAGHKPSINYIKKHCLNDVYGLEEGYKAIRGLVANHPTVATKHGNCPVCDKAPLVSKGLYRTTKNIYQWLRCRKCDHTEKGRKL